MKSSASTVTPSSETGSAPALERPSPSSSAGSRSSPITTSSPRSFASREPAPAPLTKRGFDVLLSGIGLALALPLGALIAVAVKLGDGGPVFFRQERVGKSGRPFTSYKFRSMVPNADSVAGPVQAAEDDPRVTPVGRLLRKTAMDELPQLWNIFRGDMSFVGPRALATREVELGGDGRSVPLEAIPGFAERHGVVPGLTGIAQILAPRDIPRRQKFRYDLIYVKKQNFCLDIKLILVSFWITFRGKWEVRGEKF